MCSHTPKWTLEPCSQLTLSLIWSKPIIVDQKLPPEKKVLKKVFCWKRLYTVCCKRPNDQFAFIRFGWISVYMVIFRHLGPINVFMALDVFFCHSSFWSLYIFLAFLKQRSVYVSCNKLHFRLTSYRFALIIFFFIF